MNIQKLALKKSDWQLIKSGMSKDKNRMAIQCINFGVGYIESTDGRVLFRLALEHSIPIGAYDVLSEVKLGASLVEVVFELSDVQYPDTTRVIPKKNGDYIELNIGDDNFSISSAMFKMFQYKNIALNYEFVKKISHLCETWDVFVIDKEKPALLTTKDFTVVIMPMVVEKIQVIKAKEEVMVCVN